MSNFQFQISSILFNDHQESAYTGYFVKKEHKDKLFVPHKFSTLKLNAPDHLVSKHLEYSLRRHMHFSQQDI